MINADEDAMICDFAETYQIYNYRRLPCKMAAILACGLRDDSRIKMLITKSPVRTEQILLATISDGVRTIAWMLSEDGRNGTNRPPSLTEILMGGVPDKSEAMAFESGDDFDAAWRELNGG
mgnify:CR=1 FL=1